MRKQLVLTETIYTVASLIFYTGGPLTVILSGGISEGPRGLQMIIPDYFLIKQIFLLNYIITFFLLITCWKRALYLLVKDKLLTILIGTVLFSILWSTAPQVTLERSIALVGTTLFGIYFGTRYSIKQQLEILGWVFGLTIVLSLFFAVALPKYGVMSGFHAGAWRGMYTHKNVLGAMMVLSSITFFLLAVTAKNNKWFYWGGLIASSFLLLMSRSSSPIVYLIILISIFFTFPVVQLRYRLQTTTVSLAAVLGFGLAIWISTNADALAGFFGKDLTLTGRTDLWIYAWQMIERRPWLGYGFNALWLDWDSESAFVWRAVGWQAPSSHNGFIELWLGIGLWGVLVFVIHFLTSFFRIFNVVKLGKAPEYFLPLMILLFTILSNLTEAPLLARNTIYWVLYVSSTLSSSSKIKPNVLL